MGLLYFWGRSIQEMGGNVVIGHSIYGVVVIDGSLYSQFYSILLTATLKINNFQSRLGLQSIFESLDLHGVY